MIPDVMLLNQEGNKIRLQTFLDTGKPVVIDFISTGCRTVCSTLSQGFSDLQKMLGEASGSVQLVSMSTDPDSDGPDRMKEYLDQHQATAGWDFLTGNSADIALVMKELNATASNARSPLPFFFLRSPDSNDWVRIEGASGASALLREIRKMEDEAKESPASGAPRSGRPKGSSVDTVPRAASQLVPVKGGCYQMGNSSAAEHEYVKPVHEVCIGDFSLGKHDVTVGEFRQFVDDTGYLTDAEKGGGCYSWTGSKWKKKKNMTWRNAGFTQDDHHPVVCVSWNDALAFADWISRKMDRTFRLPTEAEWEYAARSGGKNERFAGFSDDNQLYLYADFCDRNCVFQHRTPGQDDGYAYTAQAGGYKPNGLGLYDMTGNVWQWLSDWYRETYYAESPKDNPQGPISGQYRVLRGGSWLYEPMNVRTTHRFFSTPSLPSNDVGFRLASPGPGAPVHVK